MVYNGKTAEGLATFTITYSFPGTENSWERNLRWLDGGSVVGHMTINPSGSGSVTTGQVSVACRTNGNHTFSAQAWTSCNFQNSPTASSSVSVPVDNTPTVSASVSDPDPLGIATVTVNYKFPNTPNREFRQLWWEVNGQSMSTGVNQVEGVWTTVVHTACWPSGTYPLTAYARACPNYPGQTLVSATDTIVVQSEPTLSLTYSGPDDNGDGTVTINYNFHNTYFENSRVLSFEIDGVHQNSQGAAGSPSGVWTFPLSTTCWTNGSHTLTARARSCGKTEPAFNAVAHKAVTVDHKANISVAGFEERPDGTYAKITYEFPQTSASSQRRLELRRSHTDALIATTQAAQRTGTWEVLIACDPGVPVYATGKACSDAPVKSGEAMPPKCEVSCKTPNWWEKYGTFGLPPAAPPESSCPNCVGNPVHIISGSMEVDDHDPLPGHLAGPLSRTYQSRNPAAGAFGTGWITIMDARASAVGGADGRDGVFLILEDGRRAMFRRVSGAYVQTFPVDSATGGKLVFDTARNGFVHRDAGSTMSRVFRASDGRLVSLVDARGDEVTLTYDGSGKATTVADAAGRWSWIVSYGASGFVQSISVAGEPGLVWNYAYSSGKLVTVTAPGNATWRTYTYGSAGLQEVRDARGAVIERHEYDAAGRARSSFGSSGEFTDIQFNLAGRVTGETRTRAITADGKTTDFYSRFIAGRMRTVEVAGSCNCGSDDSVFAYDGEGHVLREQNSKGWVTVRTFSNGRVATTSTFQKPVGCDPQTDTSRCRLTPDSLKTIALEPTAASTTTSFTYTDPNWPERATVITADSALPGQQRQQTSTLDALTGAMLAQTSSGFDPVTTSSVQRTTLTLLYDGVEGAAFDPCGVNPSGCAFSPAWLALPQPGKHTKSVNGPLTDVADVSEYVYYPIDPAVPSQWRERLAAVRNPAGHVVRYEDYDLFGNARRAVSANGTVTESTPDLLGRPLLTTLKGVPGCDTVADALCATDLASRRMYDPPAGPLAIQIEPRGEVTSYTYDSRGRILEVIRGEIAGSIPATATAAIAAATWNEKLETQYSATTGRKTAERTLGRENGSWVLKRSESFAYDTDGRLTVATHGDGTSVQYVYEAGELRSVRDENHTSPNTFYGYDAAGRTATVRQSLASAPGGEVTTSYTYDRNGNLTSVTDANGNVTSYVYDDFGQMVRQVSPVSGQTLYAYDGAGQLLATADANGVTTTRSYDPLGRVITSSSAHNGEIEAVQWTYDAGTFGLGRMSSMTDPTGSTNYSYDRRGLLLREIRAIGQAIYTTSYGYDSSGNRTRITYPSGRVVDTTFDYAGRPISATTGSTPIVTSATYLPFGPATEIVYGNGTTRTMSYDQRYRPLSNELATQAGALARYAYGYDSVGNIISLHDELDHAYDRNFAYDDLNRLTQANTGGALWGTGTYAYDAMGNLQSSQLGVKSASFAYQGTLPKLTSVTEDGVTRPVTYDSAGNELTAGATTSAYSPRNHMVESNGFSYGYDGRGVRSLTSYPSHYLSTFTLSPATLYPNQSAAGTVTLGAPAPAGGALVELTSSSPSIVVPATVSIGEGSTTAVFGITQHGAPAAGTAVAITAKYGFTRQETVNIGVAPALTSFTLSPTEVLGGQPAQGSIVLDGPAPAGGAVIRIEISGGSASTSPSVNIAEGATTASFAIATTAVASLQDVTVSAIYGNTVTAHLSVRPPSVSALTLDPATIVSGRIAIALVTLDGPAPAGGTTVTLSSSNSTLATVPVSVSIGTGQTTQTFNVSTAVVQAAASLIIQASYNGTRSATLTLTPCIVAVAPSPTLGSDTIWMEDGIPAGSTPFGSPQWDPAQKASGSQSMTRPAKAGETAFGFSNATDTLPIGWDESLVFYTLLNECAPPPKIIAQWVASDGSWSGASWGQAQSGHVFMGSVPATGVWSRMEVPASLLNLEGMALKSFYLYFYDGQAWVDRIGKTGTGCFPAVAGPPSLEAETVWVDDVLPAGSAAYGTTQWDAGQKASGAQSLTRPARLGENVIGFSNATVTMPVTWGENLTFYALMNECAMPRKLLMQWLAEDGSWAGAAWGEPTAGHVHLGPIPTGGVWTRFEIPAALLNLEAKSIKGLYFYIYDGQAWLDRIGKICDGSTAPPPTIPSGDTVWAEDAIPAGSTPFGSPQWDPTQKASGSQSMTRAAQSGEVAFGFGNATETLPVGWGESLVFYAMTNECVPPAKVLAQWVASDGSWGRASWGQAQSGHVYMGPLPAAGTWSRMEVPASQLLLEGTTVTGFYVYVYDGQAWVDHVGKSGTACFTATALPPTLENETVWVEDTFPTGASAYGTTRWDTAQKASGSQSLTRPARMGENVIGFGNATTTMPVAWGDSLVFYAMTNECDPPRKLIVQWVATDGTWGGVSWGETTAGHVYAGAIPASGTWTRLEIAASLLNLEAKSIKGFYFYVYDGQAWLDRIGTSAPTSPLTTNREASLFGLVDRFRARLESWNSRPRISLGISAKYVTMSSSTDAKRISLYTPGLQLMAETETSTGATPPIAYEYVWFGGQPVAQIATATGEIAWYFNDHLGTPILHTDTTASVTWRVEREPYGSPAVTRAGSERHQPLGLPGQEYEDRQETAYNIYRWYRSGWGQYTQADPAELQGAGGLGPLSHLYAYARNNPLSWVDRRGLIATKGCTKDEAGFIKAAAQLAEEAISDGSNCLGCSKASLKQWVKKLQTTTYNCVSEGQEEALKIEGKISGGRTCGFAGDMFGHKTGSDVSFTVKGLTEHNENAFHGCGCMQGLLLHEVSHLMGVPDGQSPAGATGLAKKCIPCSQTPNSPLTPPPPKGYKD